MSKCLSLSKVFLLICILLSISIAVSGQSSTGEQSVVRMYVFMSPECSHCVLVHRENIERIADKLGCKAEIKYFDIEKIEEYGKLCDLEKKYGKSAGEMPVVFIGKDVFGGEKEAAEKLESTIAKYAGSGTSWPDDISFPKKALEPAQFPDAPSIEFEKTMIDLGRTKPGKTVKAVFNFKNTGAGELEIIRVRSSCGCFTQKVGAYKLQPGQSSTIEVDFDTEGLTGSFEKSVMVDSNDPSHPTVRLAIKADIIPIAVLSPALFNFGSIPVNSAVEKTITVTPTDRAGFVITSAKSDGTHVLIEKIVKTSEGYRIKVRVRAGSETGRILEKLTIRTREGGTIQFAVFGNVCEKGTKNAKAN